MNRCHRPSWLIGLSLLLGAAGCGDERYDGIVVRSTQEDRAPDGRLYTPSTQSFLRGHHWLESIQELQIVARENGTAEMRFTSAAPSHFIRICSLPLHQLGPRLHYAPGSSPDAFDAFNLMLAEYSRTSVSVPIGEPNDITAHFETDLPEAVPWRLAGNYEFIPNRFARPIRMSVINNCLESGLWELSASDRSGEFYHAWFTVPPYLYYQLVAAANGLEPNFVRLATEWSVETVPLRLERLRTVISETESVSLNLCADADSGYSSQDSRRKLNNGYVLIEKDGEFVTPQRLSELTTGECYFSSFVPPGKYSYHDRQRFDIRFLREAQSAQVRRVRPLTSYNWRNDDENDRPGEHSYLELTLQLAGRLLVLGNLPMELMVPQEDFVIHGFGVGVLSSDGIAERRQYLLKEGPAPSFAYLCERRGDELVGLNSHEYGIEQVFIRTHLHGASPWWEITITSYERMVDLVKYRVEIPSSLHEQVEQHALQYIAPLYLTYKDDNLR